MKKLFVCAVTAALLGFGSGAALADPPAGDPTCGRGRPGSTTSCPGDSGRGEAPPSDGENGDNGSGACNSNAQPNQGTDLARDILFPGTGEAEC